MKAPPRCRCAVNRSECALHAAIPPAPPVLEYPRLKLVAPADLER